MVAVPFSLGQAERMISLGVYPSVDLATARRLHADARGLLARNIDPEDPMSGAVRDHGADPRRGRCLDCARRVDHGGPVVSDPPSQIGSLVDSPVRTNRLTVSPEWKTSSQRIV
jgi:hypothetical protein